MSAVAAGMPAGHAHRAALHAAWCGVGLLASLATGLAGVPVRAEVAANAPASGTVAAAVATPAPTATAVAPPAALPPLRLLRSLSPETLQRAFEEADSAYRARQFAQAEQALVDLTELAPDFARAWLRLGNLHHQQRRLSRAEYAYRRAAAVPEYGVSDPDARHRALANLVILGLEQAQGALRDLERSAGADALQTMLGDAPARLAQLEARRASQASAATSTATSVAGPAVAPPERIVGPLPRETRGVTLARHRREAGIGPDPDAAVQAVGSDARPFGSGRGRVHGAQP